MDIRTTAHVTRHIEGWLSEKEGRALYELAKNCTQGVIVEIGSWKGKSTVWLASGSQEGPRTKVFAIDPHTGSSEHHRMYGKVSTFEEFQHNIRKAGVDDLVVPLKKLSVEGERDVHEPVGLLFIDGAHEYDMVKLDFDTWAPKLIPGGYIVFDDVRWWEGSGPNRLVRESICRSPHWQHVRLVENKLVAQKSEKRSLAQKMRSMIIERILTVLYVLTTMGEYILKLQRKG